MNEGSHIRVPDEELVETNLIYATIYGPGDEKIGSISEIYGIGPVAIIVIDVGGFLGIGAKRVAVAAGQLQFMRDEDGNVHAVTTWTKDELTEMPHYQQSSAASAI